MTVEPEPQEHFFKAYVYTIPENEPGSHPVKSLLRSVFQGHMVFVTKSKWYINKNIDIGTIV
jgi:hypothetical protein